MILGVGTDLVQVSRMAEALAKPGFAEKYFTRTEREHAADKVRPEEILAGKFAAKEAFAKALGRGFTGFGPGDLEVRREGAWPILEPLDRAAVLTREMGVKKIHLSIAHDGGMAMAFVILEA